MKFYRCFSCGRTTNLKQTVCSRCKGKVFNLKRGYKTDISKEARKEVDDYYLNGAGRNQLS